MKSWREIRKDANVAMRMNWGSAISVYIIIGIINYTITKLSESISYIGLVAFLFTVPLSAGCCYYYLCVYRRQNPTFATVFKSGFSNYGRILGGMLYRTLFLVLWALFALIPLFVFPIVLGYRTNVSLYRGFSSFYAYYEGGIALLYLLCILAFAIPSIIKSLSYFAVPYLLLDHPDVKATKALSLSKKITQGNKGKLFALQLSFAALPIGILILYFILLALSPYITWGFSIFFLLFLLFYLLYFGPYMQIAFAGFYDEIKRNALATGVITPTDLENPSRQFHEPVPPNNSF